MPEGDTVWNTARVLATAIEGQVLTRSDFRVPKLATADLSGWLVAESASYGKHLLLRLTSDGEPVRAMTLHSHLRMDGAWRTYRPGERWTGRPAHLVRVALHAPKAVAVGFHLHELAIVPTAEEHRLIGHLGPDLMGDGWDPAEAVSRLAATPDRPIADALLDQRNLAGIGNLYKAEVLFLRGVNPWTATGAVPDLAAMVELAHRLLNSNRGRWTQTTTGSLRRGETNWVFERAGRPCRRCGTKVERWTGGDYERITYWCPHCQPVVAPPPGP
ncbi:Fpg/Nei family DNA glycosylase [Dactylosporangium aurantiacum]|uniref:DNA-(apurinic or apyrimidinic site) lyase n=1 Tax=Dactylosporangium aurantiacum TaxID=35754 RepID=A0A9Q9MKV7_9ACTN|nr:DNA-formamidopyrimidine glycosylase family protein [Dactylosporangium aurantiacum]MDG6104544.1 Fpg/Nei family DNA glycosylase [Dactylosporangium aurantiacum]UWZ56156.1 Fpg/Nei family DNA glycosylase [Dactylosporangium aurantiacum]